MFNRQSSRGGYSNWYECNGHRCNEPEFLLERSRKPGEKITQNVEEAEEKRAWNNRRPTCRWSDFGFGGIESCYMCRIGWDG